MTRNELITQIREKKSYLCVGLDTDASLLPAHLHKEPNPVLSFNKAIIDATRDFCVSYKLNTAFYEAMGSKGWDIMGETFDYIGNRHLKIADAKRGDIGNTSHQYARAFFKTLNADAVTVAPYMGEDSILPFLDYPGKWTIVLGLTSNPGSNDFERLRLEGDPEPYLLIPNIVEERGTEHLYERIISRVSEWGHINNLMFVIGATQAHEFTAIRNLVPEHFLLVPGVGAQGGSLRDVSKYGMNADCGLLVNASRAVIYASRGENFAEAAAKVAREYAAEMEVYLKIFPEVV